MISRRMVAAAMLFILTGCSEPIPQERLAYVGNWQSPEMGLLILADGTVAYKRLQRGGMTSVNGPLQEFSGDNFSVGLGPLSTTFIVSQAPTLQEGRWVMVVDGVKLTKAID